MHARAASVVPLLIILATVHLGVNASPSPDAFVSVLRRGGGEHHHHAGAPLLVLNETEVAMYHEPTLPSYYTADWEDEGYQKRHGGLMIAHAFFMCLAFFVALPIGIALRSVKHAAHGMATLAFYALCTLGCAASGLYRKTTANMYEGAVHGKQSYLIILVAISLSALDILATLRRIIIFLRSVDKSPRAFWRYVVKKEDLGSGPEYSGIVAEEPEEYNSSKLPRDSVDLQHIPLTESDDHSDSLNGSNHNQTEQWAHAVHRHRRHSSAASEGTLFGMHSPTHSQDTLRDELKMGGGLFSRKTYLKRTGHIAFAVVERSLVIAGFGQLLVGIVTYTGGCRQNWINGCLAHLIKGGIFWCYGLLTFSRFLGAYADMGWSWNISPSGNKYTAEFVESLVIFIYGATNTWMERFGAHPGDPFTTKQIQHISIAVMFCFAGLLGMGIESKGIRKWMSLSTFASLSHRSDIAEEAMSEPKSYIGSFNPFPALVIGVTGAAMAAHAQTYLFQVEIHELWGNLLVAFSILRCLTYFFLWLGPSRSILPSRPPTEALSSFFLACGGLVFMLSTEEVTIAAMRRGRDDVMMFLNLAVAITCFACCWTLFIVGFKSWIVARMQSPATDRNPA